MGRVVVRSKTWDRRGQKRWNVWSSSRWWRWWFRVGGGEGRRQNWDGRRMMWTRCRTVGCRRRKSHLRWWCINRKWWWIIEGEWCDWVVKKVIPFVAQTQGICWAAVECHNIARQDQPHCNNYIQQNIHLKLHDDEDWKGCNEMAVGSSYARRVFCGAIYRGFEHSLCQLVMNLNNWKNGWWLSKIYVCFVCMPLIWGFTLHHFFFIRVYSAVWH